MVCIAHDAGIAMAPDEKLRELWRALIRHLLDRINNPPACEHCGGIAGPKPALLNVARATLKDNGINASSLSEARAGLEQLAVFAAQFDDTRNPTN
jgi:hypothetical protein